MVEKVCLLRCLVIPDSTGYLKHNSQENTGSHLPLIRPPPTPLCWWSWGPKITPKRTDWWILVLTLWGPREGLITFHGMGLDSWWLIQSLTSGTYTKEQEKGLAGLEEVCVVWGPWSKWWLTWYRSGVCWFPGPLMLQCGSRRGRSIPWGWTTATWWMTWQVLSWSCTELGWFDIIVTCGIEGAGLTSLSEHEQLGKERGMEVG